MMNYIFAFMIAAAVIFGAVTGRINEVSSAVFSGTTDAITLFATLIAIIPFWSGMMKIAEESRITNLFQRLMSPVVSVLFKGLPKNSKASAAISMNMAANLLGLGNAATPLGIIAMKELYELNNRSAVASNHMAMFVTLNTASLQLIPSTLSALRANHGSQNPMDVMVPIWIASFFSLIAGVVTCKILEKRGSMNG